MTGRKVCAPMTDRSATHKRFALQGSLLLRCRSLRCSGLRCSGLGRDRFGGRLRRRLGGDAVGDACLNVAPTLKPTARVAASCSGAPVEGLRAVRAQRSKVPKPGSCTLSPDATALCTWVRVAAGWPRLARGAERSRLPRRRSVEAGRGYVTTADGVHPNRSPCHARGSRAGTVDGGSGLGSAVVPALVVGQGGVRRRLLVGGVLVGRGR